MAAAASFALRYPIPARRSACPTATRAVKGTRRPPSPTFATRLMVTTCSMNWFLSSRSPRRPRPRPSPRRRPWPPCPPWPRPREERSPLLSLRVSAVACCSLFSSVLIGPILLHGHLGRLPAHGRGGRCHRGGRRRLGRRRAWQGGRG